MAADLFAEPLFGVAITVGCYSAALQIRKRWGWIHPLVITAGALIALLSAARIPVKSYLVGGDILTFFLGPATVALAVPLYRRLGQIRTHGLAILGAVSAGGAVAVATSWATVYGFGGSREVLLPMLSRSVTTPISMGIAEELHASTALAATFTVLSGLLGAVIGPKMLQVAGIKKDLALGLGIGTAAHGIGTSSVIGRCEVQGAAAGLAMAINGVVTSLLMIPLYPWFAAHFPPGS